MKIVWTIAGSDSGAGAGLQADSRALQAMGTHAATVVTAVTAQNPDGVAAFELVSPGLVEAQLQALSERLQPAAVKVGMVGDAELIDRIASHLERLQVPVVVDPVLVAQSGSRLASSDSALALKRRLLPLATLLTPNLHEAAALTGRAVSDLAGPAAIECAARELAAAGARAVLVKGGHAAGDRCADYWTDGDRGAWIVSPRRTGVRTHGTGCTLASVAAAALASGLGGLDVAVLAKIYINRGLRLGYEAGGAHVIDPSPWPLHLGPDDMPWLQPGPPADRPRFARLGDGTGFYPIVDSVAWMERLLPLGVDLIQLRIKHLVGEALEREIARAVRLAERFGCRLFINDYWEAALRHRAYGVHLGQEDLESADLRALAASGIRLGISTHSLSELARATAFCPSYVALGPIFPTTAKPMRFGPQGAATLRLWRSLVAAPLVAIGGITLDSADDVRHAGADIVSVISDVTRSADPESRARAWLAKCPTQKKGPADR